jgi:hypothetical protein
MSARKYTLGLNNIAGLNAIQTTCARLPRTPAGHGLPPKLVRMLANYRNFKQGRYMTGVRWQLPGYEILSRDDLLRR